MSLPFRERNPVTIGAISIAVILIMMVVAFKAADLPLIGPNCMGIANTAIGLNATFAPTPPRSATGCRR